MGAPAHLLAVSLLVGKGAQMLTLEQIPLALRMAVMLCLAAAVAVEPRVQQTAAGEPVSLRATVDPAFMALETQALLLLAVVAADVLPLAKVVMVNAG